MSTHDVFIIGGRNFRFSGNTLPMSAIVTGLRGLGGGSKYNVTNGRSVPKTRHFDYIIVQDAEDKAPRVSAGTTVATLMDMLEAHGQLESFTRAMSTKIKNMGRVKAALVTARSRTDAGNADLRFRVGSKTEVLSRGALSHVFYVAGGVSNAYGKVAGVLRDIMKMNGYTLTSVLAEAEYVIVADDEKRDVTRSLRASPSHVLTLSEFQNRFGTTRAAENAVVRRLVKRGEVPVVTKRSARSVRRSRSYSRGSASRSRSRSRSTKRRRSRGRTSKRKRKSAGGRRKGESAGKSKLGSAMKRASKTWRKYSAAEKVRHGPWTAFVKRHMKGGSARRTKRRSKRRSRRSSGRRSRNAKGRFVAGAYSVEASASEDVAAEDVAAEDAGAYKQKKRMNAYMCFNQQVRPQIASQHAGFTSQQTNAKAGALWRGLTPSMQAKWYDFAATQ